MFRLVGLVVSIGLADSLNPTTIAPALYLATGDRAQEKVAEFTLGVFAVYFLGGVAIALGPGQLILSLVPHPDAEDRHVLEVIAGAVLLVIGTVLWQTRNRLAKRDLPDFGSESRSSLILGATITAVELPTAFPYFAVIAAIVGSGFGTTHQIILLFIFNICFVLPLLGIVATLTFAGGHAERMLSVGRNFLQRHWPLLLAALMLLAGLFVVLLGVTGLTGNAHSRFGRFMRHVRHILHP